MPAPILATKFFFPPARRNLVLRPRLTSRLSEGLTRPLTLISAPAGYGKTTLLTQAIADCRLQVADGHAPISPVRDLQSQIHNRIAWLSLDEGDNDTPRFLTYLIAAVAALKPGFGEVTLALLQTPQPPPPHAILTSLLNELNEIDGPFALVLDDYHVIAARPVHEALAFLLEHLPPHMRLVVLTRADPPLPLARLRARDQLTEIRAADLRFTVEEAAAFLNRMMGLALTPEQVAALEQRTEGWIAGLQLAALSAQGRSDLHDFVAAFAGSYRYIVDRSCLAG
jgi:LuxR family maltose regulon positive regulatory protein